MSKQIRLDRLLSNLGYGSRNQIGKAVRLGAFELDGEIVSNASAKIDTTKNLHERAKFDDEPLDPLSPIYLILHKPVGYVCGHSDKDGPTIFKFLPPRFRNRNPKLSIAGRLDKDSTGLVFMTDDGDFLHKITHPKTHLPKTYEVEVRDNFNGEEEKLFGSGEFMIDGEDKSLKPVQFKKTGDKSCEMVLTEGRYHQIKKMFEKLNNEVTKLYRIQIGEFQVNDLKEGEWRYAEGSSL